MRQLLPVSRVSTNMPVQVPTEEQYNRVTIPLVRGGLFYKNDWIDLTSMVTYIAKTNNIDQQNLTKPGTSEGKTVLLIYDIQTLDGPHRPKLTRSRASTCMLCSLIRNRCTRITAPA